MNRELDRVDEEEEDSIHLIPWEEVIVDRHAYCTHALHIYHLVDDHIHICMEEVI